MSFHGLANSRPPRRDSGAFLRNVFAQAPNTDDTQLKNKRGFGVTVDMIFFSVEIFAMRQETRIVGVAGSRMLDLQGRQMLKWAPNFTSTIWGINYGANSQRFDLFFNRF